jgi:hypothetical protein
MSLARIFIGFEPREAMAYRVCVASLRQHAKRAPSIYPLSLEDLRRRGIYTRAHEERDGVLWDVISDRPMSTQFAISRFLVPYLTEYKGWALFCDCDFMFRDDVAKLFALADPKHAVMVVKHCYIVRANKMDAQKNVAYPRKNWSSLMLFNCEHPANRALTPGLVNSRHRDYLHGFDWLPDDLIGALPFEWNWIELEAKAVHFTHGCPDLHEYRNTAYADEWRTYL